MKNGKSVERQSLEGSLRFALERGEFLLGGSALAGLTDGQIGLPRRFQHVAER